MSRKLFIFVMWVLGSILNIVSLSNYAFGESVDTAWVRRYDGPMKDYDRAFAIAVDGSGNVYVTGLSYGIGTSADYATIKYDSNGNEKWVRRYNYNGPGNDWDDAFAIAIDSSGNVYVTGESGDSETYSDYATIKYDSSGKELWVRRYNGPGNSTDVALDIAIDGSNNVFVTGYSCDSVTGDDYATIKYDPSGIELWVKRYNGPANSSDGASAVAVDGSGNVYVTGYSYDSLTFSDFVTIRYYPDGDTDWVRKYNGLGNGNDSALAIALDGSNNIYVTGKSYGIGTYRDYTTIKYDSNGNDLWIKIYDGENLDDIPSAIATDSANNVYVTGRSQDSVSSFDYLTIKYYPNGDTAWVRRYDGSGNGYDRPFAIAVDTSGNVYVTGYSYDSVTYSDYVTIKYDPNGNVRWIKKYDGPVNGFDGALAMVVDASNNVYVTGYSDGSGTFLDYLTIKYVPVYSIRGNVRDGSGAPLKDSLVFLTGYRTAVDTTDLAGNYVFTQLPVGDYKVFRDSTIHVYSIHLISDTSGFNFIGYTDVNDPVKQEENSRRFALSQNYPNPFNQSTKIEFTLSHSSFVSLNIYDLLGRKIRTLVSENLSSGYKSVFWDSKDDSGKEVSSGIYFYRLKIGDFSEGKRLVLLK